MFKLRLFLFSLVVWLCPELHTEAGIASAKTLDGEKWEAWSGVQPGNDGAILMLPGEAVWRHPDGPRGSYKHGFRILNDGAADWHELYGLRLELRLEGEEAAEVSATIFPAQRQTDAPGTSGQGHGARPWLAYRHASLGRLRWSRGAP